MAAKAYFAGVGVIRFMKSGASDRNDEMEAQATREALSDGGLSCADVHTSA